MLPKFRFFFQGVFHGIDNFINSGMYYFIGLSIIFKAIIGVTLDIHIHVVTHWLRPTLKESYMYYKHFTCI